MNNNIIDSLNNWKNLTTLELPCAFIYTSPHFVNIFRHLQNLQRLKLTILHDADGYTSLIPPILDHPTLRCLDVSGGVLNDVEVKTLQDGLMMRENFELIIGTQHMPRYP
jgi:hypothetical protein